MCNLCVFSIVKVHNGFDAVALTLHAVIWVCQKSIVSLHKICEI